MTNPGEWLKGLREELHLTRVAVERMTSALANKTGNKRYRIPRGRLAYIEERGRIPNILEVQSLSECYKIAYHAVLEAFGLGEGENLLTESKESAGARAPSFTGPDRVFALSFQSRIRFDSTRLVTESAEELGVPAVVRRQLDVGQFRLGIIGLNDDTMDDLVPSGSIVVIDRSQTNVEMREWNTIQERPIYFVWHEQGYSCSWCNVVRDTLFIIPYPTSRQQVMIFKVPRAATIIGRVVHVWPPLVIEEGDQH